MDIPRSALSLSPYKGLIKELTHSQFHKHLPGDGFQISVESLNCHPSPSLYLHPLPTSRSDAPGSEPTMRGTFPPSQPLTCLHCSAGRTTTPFDTGLHKLTLIVYLSYPNYVAAKICGVNLNHFSYSHVIKTVLYTHKQSPTSLN